MPDPDSGEPRYQVHHSQAIDASLRQLQREAIRQGQEQAFISAFRRIVRAIQKDPNNVGEPLYRLPGLHLQVRTVVAPLAIDFAVSENSPDVYIKSGKLLSPRDA
jgi:hypothetical protein